MLLNRFIIALYFVLFSLVWSSCVSHKNVVYFQGDPQQRDMHIDSVAKAYVPTIKPGDILSIMVTSLSPDATIMFNPYQAIQAAAPTLPPQYNTPAPAIGYLVNEDGMVTLPLVGKVKLTNLTTISATDTITKKLSLYLTSPTVSIRILNFKISVLGEVKSPSVYTIPNEKITILEAIALAGDLTTFGKRDNILVVRDANGKRTFNRVDISRRDVFNSPYYYLHPNDVVYVEPVQGKFTSSDRSIQLLPIIISGLTLITTLLIAKFK